MVRALLQTGTVGEPDCEPQDEAEDCAHEADDGAVGSHDKTHMAICGAVRLEHSDGANPALRQHGEATDRNERDEQHPEHQCGQRDRLGVERIRLCHRRRGLDLDALERTQRSTRLVE